MGEEWGERWSGAESEACRFMGWKKEPNLAGTLQRVVGMGEVGFWTFAHTPTTEKNML